jgi:glycerophosphoryl diester phosphodiesterase
VQLERFPHIVLHRGLHKLWPENALEAFVAGWQGGWRWAECDVHRSADDQIIVLHDPTLDRTTTGTGPVRLRTWADIKRQFLRNPHPFPADCQVPRLDDLLGAMPADCGLMIEIKPAEDEICVRRAIELCAGRRCLIQSFDPANLHIAARITPRLPTALLLNDPSRWDDALAGPWQAVHIDHHLLDRVQWEQLHQAGKRMGVWTVNTPEDAARVLAVHPACVITDRPELFHRP